MTWQEILRTILGGFRPEIRKLARKLVDILPEQTRTEIVGRVVGVIAQLVEKANILGVQDIVADALEIMSDEIGKEMEKRREGLKGADRIALEELQKMIRESAGRLKQAKDIQLEKEKVLAELEAFKELIPHFQEIEEILFPQKEERKIDWSGVLQKIGEIYEIIKQGAEKTLPQIEKAITNVWETAKEIDRKAAEKVKRLRLI
jgi:hypothetical protein